MPILISRTNIESFNSYIGFWNTGEGPSIYYVIQNLGLQRHLKPLSLCIFLLSMLKKAFENVKKEKRKVKVVLA